MEEYHNLVRSVLENGTYKENRTSVDTISSFGEHYEVDLSEGYPLLTTKKMDGYRWDSMIHEVLWYLSGEEHIKNLSEKTSIWDNWADSDGNLDTSYGRFWRRYPLPDPQDKLMGETWAGRENDHVNVEKLTFGDAEFDIPTFDQISYVVDELQNNPNSRRLVVNAWHPANATVSTLPPCHFSFVFNVQGDRLNCHLTQRSGDVALGIPFNLAAYSLLTKVIAQRTGFEPGTFSHTIVDAHIYCGEEDRGHWWDFNLGWFQDYLSDNTPESTLNKLARKSEWMPSDPEKHDHVPGLLKQLTREPLHRPELRISDKPLDELEYNDFELTGYESHPGIEFGIAE